MNDNYREENTGYQDLEHVAPTLSLARPTFESAAEEQFFSDESLENIFVKSAVLATALPTGLVEFSEQGIEDQRQRFGSLFCSKAAFPEKCPCVW